jgi:hypothetical protein
VLTTRHEAEEILDRLDDIAERYEAATVANFYQMCGIVPTHVDFKHGWTDFRGASISKVRNGYLVNLPRPEPLD